MVPVLVLTHGSLSLELLKATLEICPNLVGEIDAMALPWQHEPDTETKILRKKIRQMDHGNGVVIATDMFGGTASNIALPFLEEGKLEIVTGVNLPMMMKLSSLVERDLSPLETAKYLQEAGQNSIRLASAFLRM